MFSILRTTYNLEFNIKIEGKKKAKSDTLKNDKDDKKKNFKSR